MTILYRTTDKIKVQIDDITVKVSPLSYLQKMEVQELMQKAVKENNMRFAMDGAVTAIKYSLKDIKGLSLPNGEEYELEFEDKQVTESCINDLLNIKYSQKLSAVCTSLVSGIGQDILDPNTGEKIEGISFVLGEDSKN